MSDSSGSPLRIVVMIAEGVTALAALAFVVRLFANEPAGNDAPAAAGGGDGGGAAEVDGAAIYADNCASCHGGDGGGGIGPALAGGAVVEAFPDAADQIVVVTDGRGGMPDFGSDLTPEQIEAVVEFTRTGL